MHDQVQAAAAHVEAIVASEEGRRRLTQMTTTNFEHIPAELIAHQILGAGRCEAIPMVEYALREGYALQPERVDCPVRIVWGTEDRLLPLDPAAVGLRTWFPQADWIELEGIGHCPQLDVPLEAAQLIVGFTAE